MTNERLHQEIKFRWNKLNSNHEEDFPTSYLDDAINKVVDDYIEIFYGANSYSKYKFGFEVTQQRIDMLQTLVVPDKSITPVLKATNQYKANLSELDPPYRHFLRGVVIPTSCNTKKIPVTIVRLNDLDVKLNDANTKPSLSWKRCLGSFKENNLELYTDYEIDSVILDYLKTPQKVFSGGYDTLEYENGDLTAPQSGSPQVSLELPEQYHDLIVDMVVQYLSRSLENNNKFNLHEITKV